MATNGNQLMGIKELKSGSIDQKVRTGRLAWIEPTSMAMSPEIRHHMPFSSKSNLL
jgi:hypothetical protein